MACRTASTHSVIRRRQIQSFPALSCLTTIRRHPICHPAQAQQTHCLQTRDNCRLLRQLRPPLPQVPNPTRLRTLNRTPCHRILSRLRPLLKPLLLLLKLQLPRKLHRHKFLSRNSLRPRHQAPAQHRQRLLHSKIRRPMPLSLLCHLIPANRNSCSPANIWTAVSSPAIQR